MTEMRSLAIWLVIGSSNGVACTLGLISLLFCKNRWVSRKGQAIWFVHVGGSKQRFHVTCVGLVGPSLFRSTAMTCLGLPSNNAQAYFLIAHGGESIALYDTAL